MRDWIVIVLIMVIVFGTSFVLAERMDSLKADVMSAQTQLNNSVCIRLVSEVVEED